MLGQRYTVETGDSLSSIAAKKLGGSGQWPRIWKYNNRPAVIKTTGAGIPNPNEIFPGQILLIPLLPGPKLPSSESGNAAALSPGLSAPSRDLLTQLAEAKSPISFKYKLDDMVLPPIVQPGFVVEIKMSGDILLKSVKSHPSMYVTSRREVEIQVTTEANKSLDSLLFNDTRLIYDPAGRRLTYRSMLVASPMIAVGTQFDTSSPFPKLRFEYRLPKVGGVVGPFRYAGLDIKIVIELTPKPDRPGSSPRGIPMAAPAPGMSWGRTAGTVLIVGAAALIVGTLVEDFFSGGIGIADDPASFAAASAMFIRGVSIVRSASAVLPTAMAPAAVTCRFAMVTL